MTTSNISQEPVEVVIAPTDQHSRVSQEVAEVAVLNTNLSSRISQVVLEVVVKRSGKYKLGLNIN